MSCKSKINNKNHALTAHTLGSNHKCILVGVEFQSVFHICGSYHCDEVLPFPVQRMDAYLTVHLAIDEDVVDEVAQHDASNEDVHRPYASILPIGHKSPAAPRRRWIRTGSPNIFAFREPRKIGVFFPIVWLV